jgi:hypothetical protein
MYAGATVASLLIDGEVCLDRPPGSHAHAQLAWRYIRQAQQIVEGI